MKAWFTIEQLDEDSYIISEYRHWEETHCYLLNGTRRSLLIDTGLGIGNIQGEIRNLTDKPVTAVATHVHWDHIGGHWYFPRFYAHQAELPWLTGQFPQPLEAVRQFVTHRCDLPEGYDVSAYRLFQGTPEKVLAGGEILDLGGRRVAVLHTPGHSPGHMCFWEESRGYLFTGDLVYKGTLAAWFPSTDPEAYLHSLETVAALPVRRVLPGHHALDIQPEIILRMQDAFRQRKAEGTLCHGSGTYDYGDWSVQL